MPRIYLILLLWCSTVTLKAQSHRKLTRLAQTNFEQKNYNDALALASQLLMVDSLNPTYLYIAGVSAFELREYAQATQLLNTYTNRVEKKKTQLAFYTLAQCYEAKQEYKRALKLYKKQLSINTKKLSTTPEYNYCTQRLKSCEYAIAQLKSKLKNIAVFVDSAYTKYSELYPNFVDSTTLLVARFDSGTAVTNYVQQRGKTIVVFPNLININYNAALVGSVNTVGYNVVKNKLEVATLNTSNIVATEWYEISVPTTKPVQPCIAYINDTLRIIYSATDGAQRNLYMSTQLTTTNYTTPIHLAKCNTQGNSTTPFYSQYDSALYFSTNYSNGFGGYDIVVSNYNNVTHSFGTPVNLGATVNTSYNEVYYAQNNSANKAAWVSNKPCKQNNFTTCCNDVWTHNLDAVARVVINPKNETDSAIIYTNKINALLPLTLYFHNDEPNPRTTDTVTMLSYTQTYATYNAMLTKYTNEYTKGLSALQTTQASNDMHDFFEDHVTAGYTDLQLFTHYLQKLQQFKDSSVTILMKGFCSPLATTDYNKKLAKRRIASLRNDLLQKPFVKNLHIQNKLIFTQANIGEDAADSTISDNVNDTQKSVYSIKAASERRIQIVRVQ